MFSIKCFNYPELKEEHDIISVSALKDTKTKGNVSYQFVYYSVPQKQAWVMFALSYQFVRGILGSFMQKNHDVKAKFIHWNIPCLVQRTDKCNIRKSTTKIHLPNVALLLWYRQNETMCSRALHNRYALTNIQFIGEIGAHLMSSNY